MNTFIIKNSNSAIMINKVLILMIISLLIVGCQNPISDCVRNQINYYETQDKYICDDKNSFCEQDTHEFCYPTKEQINNPELCYAFDYCQYSDKYCDNKWDEISKIDIDLCITDVAEIKKDPSICNLISSDYKSICKYTTSLHTTKFANITICVDINKTESLLYDNCIQYQASLFNDSNFCNWSSNNDGFKECNRLVSIRDEWI